MGSYLLIMAVTPPETNMKSKNPGSEENFPSKSGDLYVQEDVSIQGSNHFSN